MFKVVRKMPKHEHRFNDETGRCNICDKTRDEIAREAE